ncbi:hypothetical protein [Cohnella cellulosilytica]|uniref:Uncharacterized protein n=1 Tax=Cohnella cellulosilytica TaxID=986710 RepID=A0ABW2FCV4_9BACL
MPAGSCGEPIHPLFQPANSVLAFDAYATAEAIGEPELVLLAGSYISDGTLAACRKLAERGSAVIAGSWLLPEGLRRPQRWSGGGCWLPVDNLLGEDARELAAPYLGSDRLWRQRFGEHAIRISPADEHGFSLHFEIE